MQLSCRAIATCLVFCYAVLLSSGCDAANILAVFPFPGPSQYINVLPFLKELAARGHQLTVINAFPQKKPLPNFTDLPVVEVHKAYDDVIVDFMQPRNKWDEETFLGEFFRNITIAVLRNAEVQRLLRAHTKFDLIIVEALRIDALYGLAAHYNAPIIGLSTFGTDWNIDELVGNVAPLSFVPLITSGHTDRMDFAARLANFVETSLQWVHWRLIQLPAHERLYKSYFPHVKVELQALRKNFSLILLNQHFSLSYPRPYVPNMIEVGGLHIDHDAKTSQDLPADIANFIEGAAHGVIYFSMGSNVKSKDLPAETRVALLRTFAELKQRVLWKFEEPELPGKPENVLIKPWFPQTAVLAHPKVLLFITHGGLLSTIESIFYGKPVLGLPVFYDQFLNIKRVELAGLGFGLDFKDLQHAEFSKAVNELLTKREYSEKAASMSRLYRDQPMSPLRTAVWWTEYVLRHKGAPHMRMSVQDLSFIEYHNLDVIMLLTGALGLVLLVAAFVIIKSVKFLLTKKAAVKSVKVKSQ